jgi:hypothetical protein
MANADGAAKVFPGAAAAIAERPAEVCERWLETYAASPLRVPKQLDLRTLVSPARGVIEALGPALADPDAGPGRPALRETEKLFAFEGGNLAATGASAFDIAALVFALRDTLRAHAAGPDEVTALVRLFDWLSALALEGYATSRHDTLRLRTRDALERGTPVVLVTRELPAALLVGEPDHAVLESVFGRLLLLTVRIGARAVVIDGGGLVAPTDPTVLESVAAFARHPKLARVACIVSSLPPIAEPVWQTQFPAGVSLVFAERFDDAVARAQRA